MKRVAAFLRRLANHIDPPQVDRGLFIRVTADTSQAREALDALAASVRRARADFEAARDIIDRAKRAQEEKTLSTLQGVG